MLIAAKYIFSSIILALNKQDKKNNDKKLVSKIHGFEYPRFSNSEATCNPQVGKVLNARAAFKICRATHILLRSKARILKTAML